MPSMAREAKFDFVVSQTFRFAFWGDVVSGASRADSLGLITIEDAAWKSSLVLPFLLSGVMGT